MKDYEMEKSVIGDNPSILSAHILSNDQNSDIYNENSYLNTNNKGILGNEMSQIAQISQSNTKAFTPDITLKLPSSTVKRIRKKPSKSNKTFNMRRTVKRHFFTFLISFLNTIIKKKYKRQIRRFCHLDHEKIEIFSRKQTNKNGLSEVNDVQTIQNVLCFLPISKQFKPEKEEYNRKAAEYLKHVNIVQYLLMDVSQFYYSKYYNEQSLQIECFHNFKELLEKYEKGKDREKLTTIAKDFLTEKYIATKR